MDAKSFVDACIRQGNEYYKKYNITEKEREEKKWETVEQNKAYISIGFFNQLFLRLEDPKRNGVSIQMKRDYIKEIDEKMLALFHFTESSGDWGRMLFRDELAIVILDNLEALFCFAFSKLPTSQFGCCSSFTACSDALKCVISDKLYSVGCLYRKNLEAGRVFYGKNRNID